MDEKRREALEVAIGQIDRHFGKGTIMRLGEDRAAIQIDAIPTGSLALDDALGVGGIPRGRIIEVYGAESSGKSTLSYHIMAEAQKMGGTAAYIDAEHALDPGYSARCGVNLDDLLLSQPDSAEQALEICEYLVRSSAVDLVVIDSVAALVPKAEIDGDMGDTHVPDCRPGSCHRLSENSPPPSAAPTAPSSSSTRYARRSASYGAAPR